MEMGKLFDKLPYKEELNSWINSYAGYENVGHGKPASLEYLMRNWEAAKNEYLYKLLGDNFIVEKDIFIEKNSDDFYDAIDHNWETPAFQDFLTNYTNWLEEFKKDGLKKLDENQCYFVIRNLRSLINKFALKENLYNGDTIRININGKSITLQFGSKVSRILNKIAVAAGIEGYEAFRIAYSRIFNDKKVKGTLCLSIHPLDYMTMSDNEYCWDSCMSWRNQGCYRMGTVEMMNSPCVIVAYLKGDKNMRFYDRFWNSKKWRNLFIVNDEIICGIKGYPYQKTELDELVIKALTELASKNLGWSYSATIYEHHFDDPDEEVWLNDEKYIPMYFETKYMYNDFGNNTTTHFVIAPEVISIYCHYSGFAECMYCGGIIDKEVYIDEADTLTCSNCYNPMYCSSCDCRIDEDNSYELDGDIYCEDCYLDLREYDPTDNEYHNRTNMTRIYIFDSEEHFKNFSAEEDEIDVNKDYIPFIYIYDTYRATNYCHIKIENLLYTCKTYWGVTYTESIYYVIRENIPGKFIDAIRQNEQNR